ncbi:trp operon leader peptide [Streptomyces sp. NPDC048441]
MSAVQSPAHQVRRTRHSRASARRCASVPDMHAQTTRNWWWPAHPAAH